MSSSRSGQDDPYWLDIHQHLHSGHYLRSVVKMVSIWQMKAPSGMCRICSASDKSKGLTGLPDEEKAALVKIYDEAAWKHCERAPHGRSISERR